MGCITSRPDETAAAARSDAIDAQLKADRIAQRNEVKLLLLGSGESGKSTILKQMILIHRGPYSATEKASYKEIIFSNTVQSMKVLLEAMEVLDLPLADQQSVPAAEVVIAAPAQVETDSLPPALGQAIHTLWHDLGVQACFDRSREYQLNDSAPYYFDAIGRLSAPDYLPTDQDVLRSRVKTTGITETTFQIGRLTYKLFDVGGQRSERKKWIHCFEAVTAVLFLVAISEYDQTLYEDLTTNRMDEALTLFDSICNSRWFVNSSLILFMNKTDLFQQKIAVSPLANYFSDYTGGSDYNAALEYLTAKFVRLNQNPNKTIYTHYTCATDTQQVKFVMSAVNDTIISNNLRECGLL